MFLLFVVTPLFAAEDEWQFENWQGPAFPVRTYIPEDTTATTPIIIVMHGASRDAPRYFRDWRALGEQHGFIVVVPEFSKEDFRNSARYNLGFVFDPDTGQRRAEELWTFSAIEPLFDAVVARIGGEQQDYIIYGHSAGSQFVHRFMYYKPEARVSLLLAANAGWYTLPVDDFKYPYGLRESGLDDSHLADIFSRPLVLLLGREDTNAQSSSLRKTPEANQQGPHRLARGITMYRMAKRRAEELQLPFNWKLFLIDGADHVNAKMARPAAEIAILTTRDLLEAGASSTLPDGV